MSLSRLRQRLAGIGVILVCVAGLAAVACRYWPRPKWNVLLVTLDTTRADRIGCYGYAEALTPALDALAQDGVLFEQAYCTVPLTLPSHVSLLTGLYPPETGIHINGRGPLADGIPTLAETLQKHGYATGAFIGAVVLYGKSGLHRGFDVYDDDMAGGERHGHESHLMRSGRLVVDAALGWLKRQTDRPFFCWVHLYDPHAPFEGHAETFQDRFRDRPYDGDIAFADLQVGRLIAHLKQRGLYERTLIVVAGDHGEGFGEHDELEHGFLLYNATLRAPLVVAGPSRLSQGHRVTTPVSLVDVFPTVLDCLGVPLPGRVSGVSFSAALHGSPVPPRSCYSETEACYAAFGWAPMASVTNDRYKFIASPRPELYDLQADPDELNNLADAEPRRVEEMRQLLASLRRQMVECPESDVRRDPAHLQQLRSLGYLSGGDAPPPAADQPLPDVKDRIRYYNAEIEARKLLKSDPERAVEELRRITEAVPDFTPAWLSLGAALQTLNRVDEAVGVYRAALAANPQSADAHFDLARLHLSEGRRDKAVEHYREALSINPNFAMAHINLASILAEQGDTEAARRHFEQGLEEFPDSTVGRFNFGVFLYQQQDFEAARQHLSRAAALDPRLPQIHYQLGRTLHALEELDQAAAHFQEALRLNPRYAAAAEQLQRLQGGR